eukprot:399619_1
MNNRFELIVYGFIHESEKEHNFRHPISQNIIHIVIGFINDHDLNNWLWCLLYPEHEVLRIKENLRLLILNENITSWKLHKYIGEFKIQLGTKLFEHLQQTNANNMSYKSCEVIYNQTIQFIDNWWNDEKIKLQKQCVWVPHITTNKSNDCIIYNLKQFIIDYININNDKCIDFTIDELIANMRLCVNNNIQNINYNIQIYNHIYIVRLIMKVMRGLRVGG